MLSLLSAPSVITIIDFLYLVCFSHVCLCMSWPCMWTKPLISMLCLSLSLSPSTEVFEELTAAVQEKDSLASELHVRHIAIEQLFKNCAKLPWLHISRAGVKASSSSSGPVEWGGSCLRCWEEDDKCFHMLAAARLKKPLCILSDFYDTMVTWSG